MTAHDVLQPAFAALIAVGIYLLAGIAWAFIAIGIFGILLSIAAELRGSNARQPSQQ